jgi:hypothetical protein
MDAEEILNELTYAAGLPREALKAASAQRAKMLPPFLQEIETYLALEPAARAKPTPLFFVFHLLGEWREKVAYRPLARLLRLPGREVDGIFGDGITTTSHRVMAAVFDGDPEPLYQIILDLNAEEFIRAGMCEALAMVTLRGELDRALVTANGPRNGLHDHRQAHWMKARAVRLGSGPILLRISPNVLIRRNNGNRSPSTIPVNSLFRERRLVRRIALDS